MWTKIFRPSFQNDSHISYQNVLRAVPSFQNESHQPYQNEQQFQNAHFKEIIIFFEPLSFQKENHLSYQNEETFCQDIVHQLVFWCNLVLIFSFNFPIGP